MGAVQIIDKLKGKPVVETRAQMITDPVAKLRYLQAAMREAQKPVHRTPRWRRFGPFLLAALVLLPLPTVSNQMRAPEAVPPPPSPADLGPAPQPSVWLVEDHDSYEVYSNGLRVENNFEVANEKRLYPVYRRDTLELDGWRSGPVGIVYHTTENQQAPFARTHNGRLRNLSKWLLQFVQRRRAYHFVIDRFGRVHRVVRETDSANHAGYSVWADEQYAYVNLNPSFLGVSFETETKRSAEGAVINAAQTHAAKVLTEMLRSKYGIAPANCITHAQISVFSRAMQVGNHTDWAANFPFAELGLGNNYSLPLAAIAVFGFDYGLPYIEATGPELWRGVALGQNELHVQAVEAGTPLDEYKKRRKKKYREILQVIKDTISSEESES